MGYAYQLHPEAGVAETWDGDVKWCDTVEQARRLAWERWALEVLGDRVEWCDWSSDRHADGLLASVDVSEDEWWISVDVDIWDGRRRYCVKMDGRLVYATPDPVEAIARFAALAIAYFGPEVAP